MINHLGKKVLHWPKSSFSFKVRIKDLFFILTKNFLDQCIQFCSTTFCHFPGNFIIPSSLNFLSFWTKNYFNCLLQSSRKLKVFLKFWNFSEIWRWICRWIRTFHPNGTVFAWPSEKYVTSYYPDTCYHTCVSCSVMSSSLQSHGL